jgi:molybdopterin-guanine dinucleotide biosynthesis protein A
MRSGVILAGGSGSRLGAEKALVEVGGRPLIRSTVKKLLGIVDEVVVVARDARQAARLGGLVPQARLAWDAVPGLGPIAGLASGLASARGEYALTVGCDLPFLKVEVLELLFQLCEGYDAAVPVRSNGILETLHAVYHVRRMGEACERAMRRGDGRIRSPLAWLQVRQVAEDILRPLDPLLLTFFNINTKEDLAEARRLWLSQPGAEQEIDQVHYY